MKHILLAILSYICILVGQIWALVSFLMYLFDKVESFNWLSILIAVIGYILMGILWLKTLDN